MAQTRNILTGDVSIIEDKAVSVSIERYNELIKKEAFYDSLTRKNEAYVVLSARLEVKKEESGKCQEQ